MTITPQNMLLDSGTSGPLPRASADLVQEKVFAASAGAAATLAPLTPIAKNSSTGFHVSAVNGGANSTGVIIGFAWDFRTIQGAATPGITVNASGGGESQGNVMTAGMVDFRDIPFATFGTLDQLKAAIRTQSPSLRTLDLIIVGLEGVP